MPVMSDFLESGVRNTWFRASELDDDPTAHHRSITASAASNSLPASAGFTQLPSTGP